MPKEEAKSNSAYSGHMHVKSKYKITAEDTSQVRQCWPRRRQEGKKCQSKKTPHAAAQFNSQ